MSTDVGHVAETGSTLPLPVPQPGLTPDGIVEQARSLRALLREGQDGAEERGTYSPEVHDAFVSFGFYRTLQPRMYGGYEFDVPTFLRVLIEVSTGDPSAGWGLALAGGHCFTMSAHFGEQAQTDFYLPDGEFRAPHRPLPSSGSAVPVEGGYIVSGTWEYASSAPWSTHLMANAYVPASDREPQRALIFIVPRDRFTILDDWGHGEVLGLQASGSNSVRVEGAFVPEHHTIADWAYSECPDGTPGTELHGNPMYLGRTHSFHPAEIVATIIGAARASLDEYEHIIRTKKTIAPPQVPRFEHHDYKRVFGTALSQTDAAEAMLLSAGQSYMDLCQRWAETGETFRIKDDFRLYGIVMHAGRLAAEAVEMLFHSGGTTVARKGQRLQRYFRDVSMYRTHFIAQYPNLAQMFAAVYFDQLFGWQTPTSDATSIHPVAPPPEGAGGG